MGTAQRCDLLNQFCRFLFCDEGGRLQRIDQDFDFRDGQIMLRDVVELFLVLQEAHDLEAIVGQHFDVQTEGADVAGDAHVIEPPAQLHTRDGMILICLFAQELVKLDELDLLPVLGYGRSPPSGRKYTK